MTQVHPPAPDLRLWGRALATSAAAGLVAAVAVAHAYYDDPWRPLAHTLGVWAALAVAVAWRRPLLPAVGSATAFLLTAVVSFYVALKVGHDVRWAASGSVMGVNWDDVQLWSVLALPAGALFGWIGSVAPRPTRWGPVATAALLGILLGDALRRGLVRGADVAVAVDLLAAALVLAAATRSNRQPLATLAWTVLAAAAGLALVSGPDLLEQLLLPG